MDLIITDEDELREDFSKHFQRMQNGTQAVFTDEHDRLGRFIPNGQELISIADSCVGILSPFCDPNEDIEKARYEYLSEKYGPFC